MAEKPMQDTIQDALDDLSSSHASTARKGRALDALEKLLAEICGSSGSESGSLRYFIALQDTFQCNVPSRLLAWMSETTFRLEALVGKGSLDSDRESEVQMLSSQLTQGLTVIQGVALQHPASKVFLGRLFAQEILLDLLLVSRHVSPTPLKTTTNTAPSTSDEDRSGRKRPKTNEIILASVVLDTLLCVLVDCTLALRIFEEANGVQYVVRILKRAGTPREVRMKCLEFLYFYLMDESTNPSASEPPIASDHDLVPTAPNSPVKPSSRSTTTSSFSSDRSSSTSYSTDSGSSSFSSSTFASSFSASSFSGTSTPVETQSSSTTNKSLGVFPSVKPSRTITPPNAAKPRSLLMLKKEVDFVPLSPKKAQVGKLGLGVPRLPSKQREVVSSENPEPIPKAQSAQSPSKTYLSPLDVLSPVKSNTPSIHRPGHRRAQDSMDISNDIAVPIRPPVPSISRPPGTRTMEEKKEILGGMLGNVETLVEGVRKAGIWGLG